MFTATESVLCYPDGFTAVNLVKGRDYNFGPSFAAFMLKRGLLVEKEDKPLRVEKETKPVSKAKETKRRTRKAKPVQADAESLKSDSEVEG